MKIQVRTCDGLLAPYRVAVWLSVQRDVGRDERSSGLGFDLLVNTPAEGRQAI
jgi:hypothetical protein